MVLGISQFMTADNLEKSSFIPSHPTLAPAKTISVMNNCVLDGDNNRRIALTRSKNLCKRVSFSSNTSLAIPVSSM